MSIQVEQRIEDRYFDQTVSEAFGLVLDEADLLDRRRFDDWLQLYTEDAHYWVPLSADQTSPRDALSVVYEDRRVMETRVRRLKSPDAHIMEVPPITNRIVCNARPLPSNGGDIVLRTKFVLVEYYRERQRIFSGSYFHRIVKAKNALRIASKRVDLVNASEAHEKIAIPF